MCLRDNCLQLLSCVHHNPNLNSNCVPGQTESLSESPCTSSLFLLERTEISKLNNIHLNRMFCQALDRYVKEKLNSNVHLPLLDMCYGFSPLGIQNIKNGFTGASIVIREELHDMFHRLAQINDIDMDYLNLVDPKDINQLQGEHSVIICDIVEPSGILRQRILEDLALLRYWNFCF